MKYIAAYMLCVMGGNKTPSAKDIEKVLSSVGIQAESDKLKKVIDLLNGQSLEDLIAKGRDKLSAIPSGAAPAPAAAAPVQAAAPTKGAPPKEEKKKEEKKEEEEEDMEGGMGGLFD